ncbi:MAG: acyl-CoA dehydratase activase [Deferrisomatales bacterium]
MDAILGIDIGTSYSKAMALSHEGAVLTAVLERTGALGEDPGGRMRSTVLGTLGSGARIAYTVTTGRGRAATGFANRVVNEVICHAMGVRRKVPDAAVIADLGAVDIRLAFLAPEGVVEDFVFDGGFMIVVRRLLTLVARAMDRELDELGAAARAAEPFRLPEAPTPELEHEVVTRLERGTPPEHLAAALYGVIARRTAHLIAWRGPAPPSAKMVVTGGFSRNRGILDSLGDLLDLQVVPAPDAPFTAAFGAACIGQVEHGGPKGRC